MAEDSKIVRLKPARPCPICGRQSSQAHHPFCSARCADIDLNRWLSGSYAIPGKSLDEAAEDGELPDFDNED